MNERTSEFWQEEVRRVGGDALMQIICEIRDNQVKLVERLNRMEEQHRSAEAAITRLAGAFPSGDVDGHKRYHETMIEILAEKRRLRQVIQEKTLAGLVWALVAAAGLAGWHEFQRIVHLVMGR